jgi:hypothetical protein
MSLLLEQTLPFSYKAGKLETAATVPEGGFLFLVIYQSYFCQKFNDNKNLTGILSFSLFKCSWSASFSHLLRRSAPKQQMVCLCAAAGFIPLRPLLLSRDCVRACVCICVYMNIHDFQLQFSSFCFSQPKNWEAWLPLQQLTQMSSCDTVSFPVSLLEQYSFTAPNERVI